MDKSTSQICRRELVHIADGDDKKQSERKVLPASFYNFSSLIREEKPPIAWENDCSIQDAPAMPTYSIEDNSSTIIRSILRDTSAKQTCMTAKYCYPDKGVQQNRKVTLLEENKQRPNFKNDQDDWRRSSLKACLTEFSKISRKPRENVVIEEDSYGRESGGGTARGSAEESAGEGCGGGATNCERARSAPNAGKLLWQRGMDQATNHQDRLF